MTQSHTGWAYTGWTDLPADAGAAAQVPDLTACEREPIHMSGAIQPHGALFVVDPGSGRILQAAVGDAGLGVTGADTVGRPLADVLGSGAAPLFDGLADRLPAAAGVIHLGVLGSDGTTHHVVAHRSDDAIIVELEQAAAGDPATFDDVHPRVSRFLDGLQRLPAVEDLAAFAAREVRRITGFDRVLVYRFDEAWNGTVIAEDRNDRLPSYLDLRFPASDIPAQARELYRRNRLRLIADANYVPAPIVPAVNPVTGRPVDLSFSVLRSVSPVHLEYMRNMGTMASMSISLLHGDRLWGLISCHNGAPLRVPYHVRIACDFIGQVLSMQIAAKETAALSEYRHTLRAVQARLLAHMAGADHFVDGLVSCPDDLLALTNATGAAVVTNDSCVLVGDTPSEPEVRRLASWLAGQRREDLFATDNLAARLPEGEALKDRASGVLAIPISQIHDSYVLWFRPEVIRTVRWGGDPRKPGDPDPAGLRLHPRKSFESWKETVRLRSPPWHAAEIDAAAELRTAIVDIVLRKAEEMAALSERLASINRELEAFSYSVSHDLRAPFRHIVGYGQLLKKSEGGRLSEQGNRYLDTILESAVFAGTLVDDLLGFSRMGRATLTPVAIDMNELVAEVKRRLVVEGDDQPVEWRIADLPPTRADPVMLRLAVQNLLDNALKFSRGRQPAVIEMDGTRTGDENVYRVRDNGVGFDMAYADKLFGVFQRLHRVEEFEGTGIGLANVKRIVERHGGRVWAEGQVNGGATFFLALPRTGRG